MKKHTSPRFLIFISEAHSHKFGFCDNQAEHISRATRSGIYAKQVLQTMICIHQLLRFSKVMKSFQTNNVTFHRFLGKFSFVML